MYFNQVTTWTRDTNEHNHISPDLFINGLFLTSGFIFRFPQQNK